MLNTPTPGADMPNTKKILSSFSLFDKGKLAIVLVTLVLTLVLVWFGIAVKQKVTSVENQWHDFSNEAAHAAYVLNRIQTNFGYGGFIHNFKNYVLRKDAALITKIEKSLVETRLAINDYPLHGINNDLDDERYINNLREVVEQYAVNFELAKQLIAKGAGSNEIDQRVKVNDLPALQAIEHLSQHVVANNKKYEFETNKGLTNALTFINWGLLLVPMILLSGIFMLIFLRKIRVVNYKLEESRKFLSDLFEVAPDAMMIVDENGIINEANQQAQDLFCLDDECLMGKSVESLIPNRFREQHTKKRSNAFVATESRTLMSTVELYALDKDKNEIPVDISLNFTKRNDQKYAIVIVRNITEQKLAEERIQYLAQYDQLTKLPNRVLFNDRLQHSVERAQRNKKKIGLMFLDLDGFKNINDSLGHQAGDELLQVIAGRLLNIIRTEDTVARLGGDEFTMILEELEHSDHAVVVAKKVLQVVGEVIYLSGHEVTVGVSIGISIYPDNGKDANSLINNADKAMYEAKRHGKNCYKFFITNKE